MTMDDLGKVTGLRKEIELLDLQIRDLELWGSVPSARNPFESSGSGASIPSPSDPTAAYAYRIQQLRDLLFMKRTELTEKLVEIEFWVKEVDNPLIRSIIRSHYLMGKTWRETAKRCCNSNNKETAFVLVKRYLKK